MDHVVSDEGTWTWLLTRPSHRSSRDMSKPLGGIEKSQAKHFNGDKDRFLKIIRWVQGSKRLFKANAP